MSRIKFSTNLQWHISYLLQNGCQLEIQVWKYSFYLYLSWCFDTATKRIQLSNIWRETHRQRVNNLNCFNISYYVLPFPLNWNSNLIFNFKNVLSCTSLGFLIIPEKKLVHFNLLICPLLISKLCYSQQVINIRNGTLSLEL